MINPIYRSFFVVLLLVSCAGPAAGQLGDSRLRIPAEINGQVRFAAGGAPAFQVLVRLERFSGGLAAQETTDRNGKFRFPGLGPEQYYVTVRAPGYKEIRQPVDLQTDTRAYLQIQLVADESQPTHAAAGMSAALDAKVPAEARKEFEKGQSELLEEKKVESAILHLEKAVSLYPDFFQAHMLLGTAYMDAKKLDKAERALRRTLELDAKSAAALFALGEVYRQQKRYADAEKVLQEGLKLDARSWQGHLTLGRVYWDMGDLSKAGPEVGRTIQLKPDAAEAHLLAGNILLKARQAENALVEFEEYLRLDPKGAFATPTRELVEKIKRALAEKKK